MVKGNFPSSVSEQMRQHMLIPLLHAATSPRVFSTGSKNRKSFISPTCYAQEINRQRTDDEASVLRPGRVPTHPSRPCLRHRTPSFSIEKHFMLPPILYVPCSTLPRRSLPYQYTQSLSSSSFPAVS